MKDSENQKEKLIEPPGQIIFPLCAQSHKSLHKKADWVQNGTSIQHKKKAIASIQQKSGANQ